MSDDRRELLEAALDQAEEGTLEAPIEKEIEVNDDPIQAENEASDSTESNDNHEENRDEKVALKPKMPKIPPITIVLKKKTWWQKLLMKLKQM